MLNLILKSGYNNTKGKKNKTLNQIKFSDKSLIQPFYYYHDFKDLKIILCGRHFLTL